MFRYFQADSSPQLHYNCFCIREEVITINGKGDNLLRDVSVHVRSLPVTVLGWGESSVEQKFAKLLHSAVLENGECAIDQWRHSVRGFLTDQGTERHLNDIPNVLHENSGNLRSLLNSLRVGDTSFAGVDAKGQFLL